MGFVQPHPSLATADKSKETAAAPSAKRKSKQPRQPSAPMPTNEADRAIVMSIVERAIAMIRSRRGLKAIETMEQVQFLATYVTWIRENIALSSPLL